MDGSKALSCFHQVWLKGTTHLSLRADEPTDNGFCYCSFFPLELLLAGRMLETGAGMAEQALVVGSLLRPDAQKSPGKPEVNNPEEVWGLIQFCSSRASC